MAVATGSAGIGNSAYGSGGIGTTIGGAPEIISLPDNESSYEATGINIHAVLKNRPALHYSCGLYTHSSGDYYLIKIESGVVYAGKLLLSAPGSVLQRKYRASYAVMSTRLPIYRSYLQT